MLAVLAFPCIAGLLLYDKTSDFANNMLAEQAHREIRMVRDVSNPLFAIIGTSRARSHNFPKGTPYINLAGPYTIPTIMYFKAKSVLRYHPNIPAVYLEADEHLFFYGQSYSRLVERPNETPRTPAEVRWGSFLDEEAAGLFPNYDPSEKQQANIFDPDIKPIIIKRITHDFFAATLQVDEQDTIADPCSSPKTQGNPGYPKTSTWSMKTNKEKAKTARSRAIGFSLIKPTPLDSTMMEYFEKTIDLLQHENVQVILVKHPVTHEYLLKVHPENQSRYERYLNDLIQRKNLSVLDLRPMSDDPAFFKDSDHPADEAFHLVGAEVLNHYCQNRPNTTNHSSPAYADTM